MAANTCNQPPSFHDGTGSQADYTIGFPYINRADIEVYVGSADDWTQYTEGSASNANEYEWKNSTTLRLNAASGTDNVRITRETDRCAADTTFTSGASLRAEDLNDNMTQNLYITQEIVAALGDIGVSVPPGSSGEVDTSKWNDPSYLKWTGEGFTANGVLESGDAWQDSDDWIATAAAGDDRWLTIPGGGGTAITAGDGIRIDSPAEINVDLAGTNPGLQFTGGDLQAIGNSVTEDGGNVRLTNGPSNITISGSDGITITRNSATQFTIGDSADNNTTYDFGNTAVSGNARLRLTGSDSTTDDVLITAGNNITFSSQSATGFTINSTGGGGGGSSAEVVADVAGLNTAADGPPSDGDLFLLLDSTNLHAAAVSGDNDEDVNGLPMAVTDGAPVGGYGGQIQVTLEWDNGNTRWQFIRWAVQEPDNRYVLEQGDTMTGTLTIDNTTANENALVTGNGHDIVLGNDANLVLNAADGTATLTRGSLSNDPTYTLPNASGTVALTTDVTAANTLQQVTAAGNASTNDIQMSDGAGVIFQNGDENQTVEINADDATESYTVTLPPTAPTANGQVLSVASGTNDAELEWSTPAAGINGIRVEDDGASVVATATALNFTGAGVTVTDSGSGEAEIAISGGGGGGVAGLTVVANPTLTGSMLVGQEITVNNPTITGGTPGSGGDFVDGYERDYQWERSATVDGTYTNIAGATNQTYTLVAADSQQFIRCAVTNTDNSATAQSIVARNIPAQVFRGSRHTFAGTDTTPTSQQWGGTPWDTTISGTSPTNPAPDPRAAYIGIQARIFNCLVEDDGTRTYVDQLNCRKAQVGNWLRMGKTVFRNIDQPWNPDSTNTNTICDNTVDNNWFDNNLPAWASGTAYAVGDQVRHNGDYWYCSVAHTSSNSGQTQAPRSAGDTDPNVALDGTDGQFMMEVPRFSCEKTWDDNKMNIVFTLYDGENTVGNARVHPLFTRNDGTTREFAYLGKFFSSTAKNTANSMNSIPSPAVNYGVTDPHTTTFTMAQNRGADWYPFSYWMLDATAWLHLGEYGTTNPSTWSLNQVAGGPIIAHHYDNFDQVYWNQSFNSMGYASAASQQRLFIYRGLNGNGRTPLMGMYLANSPAELYINLQSVTQGLSSNKDNKYTFDISNWPASNNTVYTVSAINCGELGDDVSLCIPNEHIGSQGKGGYNNSTAMNSLGRYSTGWVTVAGYSMIGSLYLAANTSGSYNYISYLP